MRLVQNRVSLHATALDILKAGYDVRYKLGCILQTCDLYANANEWEQLRLKSINLTPEFFELADMLLQVSATTDRDMVLTGMIDLVCCSACNSTSSLWFVFKPWPRLKNCHSDTPRSPLLSLSLTCTHCPQFPCHTSASLIDSCLISGESGWYRRGAG